MMVALVAMVVPEERAELAGPVQTEPKELPVVMVDPVVPAVLAALVDRVALRFSAQMATVAIVDEVEPRAPVAQGASVEAAIKR